MMKLKELIEFIKLKPRYIFAITLISAIFLFTPDNILSSIALVSFRKNTLGVFGFLFIASISVLIVSGFSEIVLNLKKRVKRNKTINNRKKYLRTLSTEEKGVLKEYITKGKKSCVFRYSDGIIRGLEYQKIVYRASELSEEFDVFPYNIQPWAWKYLNKHRNLLE